MNRSTVRIAFAALLLLPLSALAHKAWLLPSQTVLSSGDDTWVTVDAAYSNDLFYFNHHPLPLDALVITAPDGGTAKPANASEGQWRSTFDVQLEDEGTYQLAVASEGLYASYQLDGESKRWRGSSADAMASEIPRGASDLEVTEYNNRIETFVTVGAPSKQALAPASSGLDLEALTHPNDLYAGESATFRLLRDGKPASGVPVTVIRGGTRYRTSPNVMEVTTDADGKFTVAWPEPGMYWLHAETESGQVVSEMADERSLSYTATLEVLPQ